MSNVLRYFLCAAAIVVGILPMYAQSVPELMYYKFNETGGPATENFASSPVGTNPAPLVGLTMGGTGQFGSALIGTGTSNNYVNTGWTTNLGTGPWTISMWLNALPSNTTLYYLFGDNTAGSFRCFLGGAAGAGNLLLRGTGSTDVTVTGVAPGPTVVTFVYDGVGTLKQYKNGVPSGTTSTTYTINGTGATPFRVGAYSTSVGLPPSGLMDEFRIYNRALDDAEVALTWNSSLPLAHNDYGVGPFLEIPSPMYEDSTYTISAKVTNNGDSAQTNVPVRFFVNGVQYGSDILVSLAGGQADTVSYAWTPLTGGDMPLKVQSFLSGDEIPANDSATTTVNVIAGFPPAIGVIPDSIVTQVASGDSIDVPVQVSNTGGSPLTWSAQAFLSRITMRTITLEPEATRAPSGSAEASPHMRDKAQQMTVFDAPFDLQFSFDLAVASGANGNAGAEFDGTYYYTTRWASNLLHKYTMAGALVEAFSIPGVTGLRDLAFDGTYMYGGAAANTIYQMDFVSKTLIGTITSPVAVRHIAYDPRFDGFWVGTWDTPVVLINRSGQQVASLPNTLVAKYGSAYDDWTSGGPYLWVFNQDMTTGGSPQNVHQFNLNTLLPTGFTHNVWPDVPSGATAIAGGLWASEGVVSGKASLGGVMQGVPDYFFVYELAQATPVWMALVGTTSGTIPAGGNSIFTVRLYGVDSASLASHMFSGSVVVTSNAGDVTIPVTLDVVTGVDDQEGLPTVFSLDQNYPNPFNPTTTITYALPTESRVKVTVYDVVGREVVRLVNEQQAAGTYDQDWDGRNAAGLQVGSGVYFYKMEATPGDGRPVYTNVRKMVMLK